MSRRAVTRRTAGRLVAVLGLTVLALGLGTSAASAGSVVAAAAPLSAPQGATITIAGNVSSSSICPSGAPVQLTSTGTVPGTNLFPNGVGPQVPRDASDNFKATFVIPATTPVGSYTIGVTCGTTAVAVTQVLNVTAGKQTKPSITVSPTSAAPGDTVTIAGVVPTSGTVFCPSGDATQLTSTAALFPPDGFSSQVSRDATGNFHTTYTIPATTAPGAYSIGVRCGGGNVGVTASLKVTASAATTTTVPSTTTTTPSVTTTTLLPGPVTTVPGTVATTAPSSSSTTAPPASGKKKSSSSLRWVALGVFALVVIAVTVVFLAHRRGAKAPV